MKECMNGWMDGWIDERYQSLVEETSRVDLNGMDGIGARE
jgi:hypothetical protein